MTERDELNELRRMAELEARASGPAVPGNFITDQQYDRMTFSPSRGVSPVEAATIAAGRTADKTIKGTKALAPTLTPMLPMMRAEENVNDAAFRQLEQAHPTATAIGGALPYMGIPGSMGAMPGALLTGGLEALQFGSPEERTTRGLAGGGSSLVGGLLGRMAGSAIAPVNREIVNDSRQAALDAAGRLGFQPRLSQVTGSALAQRIEDASARAPGGAGVMSQFEAGNRRAVNQAAARSIGEQATEMGPDVFSRAATRLGQVFEDIKGLPGKTIAVGQNVGTVADDILRQQGKMIPSQRDEQLVNLANQAKSLSSMRGKIDGETYQLTRSGLSEASYDATGTNKALYGRLLSALDDSAEASLRAAGKGDLADALRSARPQYANLKLLEKGTVAEGGNVSPARVAQAMRTQNPGAFREGRMAGNPLYDVALVGEGLPPLRAGSPTFERGLLSNPLSTMLAAPLAYAGAKVTTSPLATMYPATLGNTDTARALALMANPALRVGTMGILQRPALSVLGYPVAAE